MTATGIHCYKHIDLCYAWRTVFRRCQYAVLCTGFSARTGYNKQYAHIYIISNLFMLQNNDHQITIGKSLQYFLQWCIYEVSV